MAPQSPIPLIYRIVFTYIDPLFCLFGFWTHVFSAADTLASYSPTLSTTLSIKTNPGTQHILDNLAAFFAYLFVIEAILLRVRSHDTTVWRVVQAGGAMLDLVMTVGALRMLGSEGRLADVGSWRGDDWRYVAGNAGMGVIRVACALGVGMGRRGKRD